MNSSGYAYIIVESFNPRVKSTTPTHIRPISGQGIYSTEMMVECSRKLLKYPLGTRFKIRAKITDREGGRDFIYTNYTWPFEVI
jgi:hypothetical protein